MIVGLALRTGIAPSVWAAEDPRSVLTALNMLEEIDRERNG
ncbi:hypothetical protein [Curtobacterium phage Penoan]|nr:hypothetical protein [Curtobacterium phage Penoan]